MYVKVYHNLCFRYESKGKQWAKNRPDHPVGLAPDDVAGVKARQQTADVGIPGLAPSGKQGEHLSVSPVYLILPGGLHSIFQFALYVQTKNVVHLS